MWCRTRVMVDEDAWETLDITKLRERGAALRCGDVGRRISESPPTFRRTIR